MIAESRHPDAEWQAIFAAVPTEGISPEVTQFLRTYIQSVEQLEVLALLHRDPKREWTVRMVYDVILSNETSLANRLAEFTERGILVSTPSSTYRYDPKTAELHFAVELTLKTYQTHHVRVIETIFGTGPDPVQSFADAFRIRKK